MQIKMLSVGQNEAWWWGRGWRRMEEGDVGGAAGRKMLRHLLMFGCGSHSTARYTLADCGKDHGTHT